MTTSALRRQVKNIVHNYSEAEIKWPSPRSWACCGGGSMTAARTGGTCTRL
ncbi:EPN3 isoform 6 [Pan troglodytes]|uniref:EPN3 isoform 3 n=2 Tax=Hominidae TaxID=9604 RepID=A0A2J8W8J2_PONAB|nr:EPN3 isoform 3 [Pan troglodytes]PNI58442.1 EPN3 isoform 6 [Pan troglodytes]PNJ66098.1 EPN3 isoform 3 [Pongo abelii]PNJ66101.1 EPN3 isoform 6 [Pongo abelii]